jgi:hypothetical protein
MLLAAIAIGLAQAVVVAGISALRPKTNIYKTIVLVAFAAVPSCSPTTTCSGASCLPTAGSFSPSATWRSAGSSSTS